jgi:thioredoxin-dependent peroxiredoxin
VRDAIADLAAADTAVLGINFADAASHQAFIDAYDFPFDLLVDEGSEVSRTYDALKPDGSGIRRTVYLIGKDGRILHKEQGAPPPGELLEILRRGTDEVTPAV